jgi:hypothetical protein
MKKINWRYALGELLIVTIGITIAFSLNNLASSVKDNNTSKTYLLNLSYDLQTDINQLDSNVSDLEERVNFIRGMFRYLGRPLDGKDSIAKQFFNYIDPVYFVAMDVTLQSLKFSGDLKLIENIDLKNKIIRHYTTYDKVESEAKRHEAFAKNFLARYFMENIDYTSLYRDSQADFMDQAYFRNLVSSLYGIYTLELDAQRKALVSAKLLFAELTEVQPETEL